MKDSAGYISKMSTRDSIAMDSEKPVPEIPDSKWNDMMVEEEFDQFILEIREEIIHRSEEIWYKNYMDRQAISFTIHCAYLAWVKVINIYYMPRDQCDQEQSMKGSWEPDDEPEPAKVDSWATEYISISKTTPKAPEHEINDPSFLPSPSSTSVLSSPVVPSVYCPESSHFGENDFGYMGEFFGESLDFSVSKRSSIFTRTLTMSRELLPLFEELNLSLRHCRDEVIPLRKKAVMNMIRPTFIDVTLVPPNW